MSHIRDVLGPVDRRRFLTACGAGGLLLVPGAAAARAGSKVPGFEVLDLKLDGDADLARRALVLVPEHLDRSKKHRMVVLLHGYGAAKSERTALAAWSKDYGVVESYERLRTPPVGRARKRVWYWNPDRLKEINSDLSARPFGGLVLVCPVTPNVYFVRNSFARYAEWLETTLLPEVRKAAPVRTDAAGTGLAGHSMGGWMGMEVMIRKPELFGAFSGVQVALKQKDAWRFARRLAGSLERVGGRRLQLHTSKNDAYHDAITLLHQRLDRLGVQNDFRDSWGNHTRVWMQELGSVETLYWQDRALGSGAVAKS